MLSAFRNVADDARKLAEVFLTAIMTPAVAGAAAELIDAGSLLTTIILGLAWVIVIARGTVTGLELWQRYASMLRARDE